VLALRLWIVAAGFAVVAIARSIAVGIPFRDPGGDFFVTRVAITIGLFVGFATIEAVVRTPRGSRSASNLWATFRRRWPARRLATAWACLLAYHVVYVTYHNLKSWDVLNQPRDHDLTRVDQWLFLGHSPAVLLHDLLGQGAAAHILLFVYETFPTLVVLVVAGSVFTERLRDGITVLASLIFVWILGTATYYAVPSLGPFYDRPQDFAALPETHATRTQALYMAQRDHLLAHPGAADAFAQVSAFASLHVGVTTVITLMAAYLGYRRIALVLWIYIAVVCVATVYLGWHFVVDDIAGLVIGWAAVRLGILLTGNQRPRRHGGQRDNGAARSLSST
jgi:membrane-associated phospholipid phosphatase